MVSPALSTFCEALPVKFAVIVPAEKLPDASRATMALAVLALVAVVAELATLPAVEIVASFVSTIPAPAAMSVLVINELDKLPEASLCTIPAVANALIEIVPPDDIFRRSKALVLNDKSPLFVDNPLVVLPVNISEGNAVVPAGNCKVPVMMSPVLSTLLDALPVTFPTKFALIVPALKLPEPSRTTILPAVLALDMVANFALLIVAFVISASTINELESNPDALLCTTPDTLNPSIVTPEELIFICSVPLTSNERTFAVAADNPVLVLPVN
jgi:hypothetical protein